MGLLNKLIGKIPRSVTVNSNPMAPRPSRSITRSLSAHRHTGFTVGADQTVYSDHASVGDLDGIVLFQEVPIDGNALGGEIAGSILHNAELRRSDLSFALEEIMKNLSLGLDGLPCSLDEIPSGFSYVNKDKKRKYHEFTEGERIGLLNASVSERSQIIKRMEKEIKDFLKPLDPSIGATEGDSSLIKETSSWRRRFP